MASKFNAVDLAYDILEMQRTIDILSAKVERLEEYERKYNELLSDSLKHSQVMSWQVMGLLLNKGEFKHEKR